MKVYIKVMMKIGTKMILLY